MMFTRDKTGKPTYANLPTLKLGVQELRQVYHPGSLRGWKPRLLWRILNTTGEASSLTKINRHDKTIKN